MKLSRSCNRRVTNLACEAIAACFADDPGLSVPRSRLIEIPPEYIPDVTDMQIAEKLHNSSTVAFGSTRGSGFRAWLPCQHLTAAMHPLAAEILLFDAIIQNPDRRTDNPNCLVPGHDLRIIEHELAFAHRMILMWKAPWVEGGMETFETPGNHIFVRGLKGKQIDFGTTRDRWRDLSDTRLNEYKASIPPEWAEACPDIDAALKLIADARNNIGACIGELERILS